MAQPALGIAATAIVIAISFGYIALWDFGTFNGWIAFFALSFIPFEVVTGVIWGGNPPFVAGLRQPVKGLVLLLVTLLVGAVVSQLVYRTLGASQGDPGPMLAFFSICVIVTTFFWTIAFGGWPFTAMIKNPVAAGLATWLGCYVVGCAIYWIFCDFTFLEGAPVYVPSADPKGLFNAWNVPVYYMAALTILFAWLCFDLWPLDEQPRDHETAHARGRAGRRVAGPRLRDVLRGRVRDGDPERRVPAARSRSPSSSGPFSS